jgi:hypothetical protein
MSCLQVAECWAAGLIVEELRPGDPRQIGSYRLLGRLGSGGMGQVFLGRSRGGRLVAVKVIRPELADGPEFRSRFAREVAAARRVSGMFTAPVVDADPDAPQPWLVTAYVEGPSLADHVGRNGAMPDSEVIGLGRALAEGVAAIHAAGVVHRDLKPSNVLLAADGPRIIDFGVSRAVEATALTRSGLVMGSPGFMSPEQARGLEISAASDVFSLGAVLAFAATGTEPFGTGDPAALLYRVVHAEPDLSGISGGLRHAVEACLRKDPAERPAPASLLGILVSVSNGQPRRHADPKAASAPARPARPASAGSPAQLSARPRPGPAAVRATAVASAQGRDLAAEVQRRRQRWPWVALAAVLLVAGAGFALAAHGFGMRKPPVAGHSSGPSLTPRGSRMPSAVVGSFLTAINDHNWEKVWLLGGKNLSTSYASMVYGFRLTGHDVMTGLTTDGHVVTVGIRAHETNGAVQVYLLRYVVKGGIITSGQSTLISSCPRIRYGADGTAAPLFCSNGEPNPPVLAHYRTLHLRVLKLGPDATPARVLHAMCADVHQDSTYPIETAAYFLARKINGWSFGISPPEEMLHGACS